MKLSLFNYCVYPFMVCSCLCSNMILSNLFSIYDLHLDVRFEVLTALSIKTMVIWDVMPCNLVWMSTKVLMELCYLYLQGGSWRAVSSRMFIHIYDIARCRSKGHNYKRTSFTPTQTTTKIWDYIRFSETLHWNRNNFLHIICS